MWRTLSLVGENLEARQEVGAEGSGGEKKQRCSLTSAGEMWYCHRFKPAPCAWSALSNPGFHIQYLKDEQRKRLWGEITVILQDMRDFDFPSPSIRLLRRGHGYGYRTQVSAGRISESPCTSHKYKLLKSAKTSHISNTLQLRCIPQQDLQIPQEDTKSSNQYQTANHIFPIDKWSTCGVWVTCFVFTLW